MCAKYRWKVGVVKQNFWRFVKDDSGVSAIEYGFIAGFMTFAIFSVLTSMGGSVGSFFSILSSDLQNIATGVKLRGD